MHIWLLTHAEELKKANGTGSLVQELFPERSSLIVWHRKEPAQAILELASDETLLLYPNAFAKPQHPCQPTWNTENTPKHVILLDGTWQQARKMYNQSPYLHSIPLYELQGYQSKYQRRRNQQKSGLCTAESAIALFNLAGLHSEADLLESAFLAFNQESL